MIVFGRRHQLLVAIAIVGTSPYLSVTQAPVQTVPSNMQHVSWWRDMTTNLLCHLHTSVFSGQPGRGPSRLVCSASALPGMPQSGLIPPLRAFFSLNVDVPAIYTTLQGDGCLLPAPFEPGSRAALHLERDLLDPCSQQRAEVRGSLIKSSNFHA